MGLGFRVWELGYTRATVRAAYREYHKSHYSGILKLVVLGGGGYFAAIRIIKGCRKGQGKGCHKGHEQGFSKGWYNKWAWGSGLGFTVFGFGA